MSEQTTKRAERLSTAALFVVTVLWGGGFIFSKLALDSGLGAGGVMVGRFTLAALVTGLFYHKQIRAHYQKGQWKGGAIIGAILFSAFYTQTTALKYTTPSNNAFITGIYVVLVPLILWVIQKQRPPVITFVACVMSFAGVAILSVVPGESLSIGLGDGLTLVCAVLFAGQIVATGILAKTIHPTVLVFMQFTVCAGLSWIVFLFTDRDLSAFVHRNSVIALLYLGLLSTFVCYLLQTIAQTHLPSSKTGIIMATEAVFGSLFSVLFGYDALTARMVVGGLIMFLSIILPDLYISLRQKRALSGR